MDADNCVTARAGLQRILQKRKARRAEQPGVMTWPIGRPVERIHCNDPMLAHIAPLLDMARCRLRGLRELRQKGFAPIVVANHGNDRNGEVAEDAVKLLVFVRTSVMGQITQQHQRLCIRMSGGGGLQHAVQPHGWVQPDDRFPPHTDMRVADKQDFLHRR